MADGLGSSKHSDVASKIAANSSVEYCADNIRKGMKDSDILKIIQDAFNNVNFAIKRKAGDFLDDFDTTLTLAVFINGDVYYGHAGDSGIIALRCDGVFDQVTKAQLGSGYGKERPVYPLAAESHWIFEKYKYRAKALFLMTDGVLNKAVPPLLEYQKYKLDHAYLYYLYDNLIKNPDLVNWVNTELARILPQEINYDDKTLVAVICTSVKLIRQRKEYYEFPSKNLWGELFAKHNKQLYGYKNNETVPFENNTINQVNSADLPNNRKQKVTNKKNRKNNLRPFVKILGAGFVFGVIIMLACVALIHGITGDDISNNSSPELADSATDLTLQDKATDTNLK